MYIYTILYYTILYYTSQDINRRNRFFLLISRYIDDKISADVALGEDELQSRLKFSKYAANRDLQCASRVTRRACHVSWPPQGRGPARAGARDAAR